MRTRWGFDPLSGAVDRKMTFGLALGMALIIFVAGTIARKPSVQLASSPEEVRIETVISIDDDEIAELVAGAGSIWALNGTEGKAYEIRVATNELGSVIETDDDSEGLAIADGRVWTVTRGTGFVTTSP